VFAVLPAARSPNRMFSWLMTWSQFRQRAVQCSTIFVDARYSILRRESSLVKDGLFLVIRRNCRLSPSMILVVYMIFRISGGYAKNVDRISQLSSQLLTQEGYAGHVRIPHNAEFLIQLSHRCITTLRSSSCF